MTGSADEKPLIGIVTSTEFIAPQSYQVVGEKYIEAIAQSADATPFLVPSLQDRLPIRDILGHVDGILITGAQSNVAPAHYGNSLEHSDMLLDRQRELTTLPLFEAAAEAGVPFLAICLGFQEMNVAFGGTLHQQLHKVPGRLDHREDETAELASRYAAVHDITTSPGGLLEELIGPGPHRVNSLHSQGVDELGRRLQIQATAEDGTIEAISVSGARTFALGVQWHPEWRASENTQSAAIFQAFGEACRQRMAD